MPGPEPFLWGAATSAHQVEGNNTHSDWWKWEQQGAIEGGAQSGLATDHWNRFREDLSLAAELGLTSYRFSLEWSRIEPEPGCFDESALEWYETLVAECERLSLLPLLTLHHFTSPLWFTERGGFAWSEAVPRFLHYAEKIVDRLGSKVPLWCTFNEPMVLVAGTYLAKLMPPARHDPKSASLAITNLLRAHAHTYDLIHARSLPRKGLWRDLPLRVGIAHNMLDFRPDRAWHPLEQAVTWAVDRFYNQAWLRAVATGEQAFSLPGILPRVAPVPELRGRCTADYLGVNYYTKGYVRWRPKDAVPHGDPDLPVGIAFARRKEPTSDMDWAIYPEGLGRVLRKAWRFGLPIFITENGIADADDSRRMEYIRAHLLEIARAIQAGIDVRGYYHWSLLDNFEWIKGFGPRFGLVHVNYDTFARTVRPSAWAFRDVIAKLKQASPGGAPQDRLL